MFLVRLGVLGVLVVKTAVRFFRPIFACLAILAFVGCSAAPSGRPGASGTAAADEAFRRGETAYLRGKYDQAAAAFRSFLSRHPGHAREPEARFWLGGCLLVLDDATGARAQFEQVLASRGPEEWKTRARGGLGDLSRRDEAWAAAAGQYAQAAARNAGGLRQEEYLYWGGICRIRAGDGAAGRRDLERLVREFPSGTMAPLARAALAVEDRRFRVQVGAFRDPAGARAEQADLKRRSVTAELRAVPGETPPRFLLLTGAYPDYPSAEREAERLKTLGIDAFPLP